MSQGHCCEITVIVVCIYILPLLIPTEFHQSTTVANQILQWLHACSGQTVLGLHHIHTVPLVQFHAYRGKHPLYSLYAFFISAHAELVMYDLLFHWATWAYRKYRCAYKRRLEAGACGICDLEMTSVFYWRQSVQENHSGPLLPTNIGVSRTLLLMGPPKSL